MNSSGDAQLVGATPGFRDLDPAVLETMLRDKVGSLVVVDAGGQLRGMVTFRTLAKRLAQRGVDASM